MSDRALEQSRQYVSFFVDESLFGLDIYVVKEVNTNVDIATVPLSKECFRGVVNIRGQIVLVIDISIVLGKGPSVLTADSRLVILKTAQEVCNLKSANRDYEPTKFGDKPMAFLVDRIGDVLTVARSKTEQAPSHLSEKAARLIECVVHLGEDVLTVVNPEALLAVC